MSMYNTLCKVKLKNCHTIFKTKRIYLVVLEEFKNSKDNVVDIAESRCLALLGVMEASGPVDGNIRGLLDE